MKTCACGETIHPDLEICETCEHYHLTREFNPNIQKGVSYGKMEGYYANVTRNYIVYYNGSR